MSAFEDQPAPASETTAAAITTADTLDSARRQLAEPQVADAGGMDQGFDTEDAQPAAFGLGIDHSDGSGAEEDQPAVTEPAASTGQQNDDVEMLTARPESLSADHPVAEIATISVDAATERDEAAIAIEANQVLETADDAKTAASTTAFPPPVDAGDHASSVASDAWLEFAATPIAPDLPRQVDIDWATSLPASEHSTRAAVDDDEAPLLDDELEHGIASVFAALHSAAQRHAPDDSDENSGAADEAEGGFSSPDDVEAVDGLTFRLLGELDRLWHRAA